MATSSDSRKPITTSNPNPNPDPQGVEIIPSQASPTELSNYITWRLQVHSRAGWKNDVLSEYYADYFRDFTREKFDNCHHDTVRFLRGHLRQHGVYIRKGRGVPIGRELFKAVQEDVPWPDDDSEAPQNLARSARSQFRPRSRPPSRAQSRSLSRPPTPTTQPPTGHGRELANLAKLYTSEDSKYSGEPDDSFNFKYAIFLDLCGRVDIPPEAISKAFPTMLRGLALDFYYTSCHDKNLTIHELCVAIRAYFEGPEHRRNVLARWNQLTFQTVINTNSGKSTIDQLHILIRQLRELQRGLDAEFQSDTMLFNRLVHA